jgi:hypothetical protein
MQPSTSHKYMNNIMRLIIPYSRDLYSPSYNAVANQRHFYCYNRNARMHARKTKKYSPIEHNHSLFNNDRIVLSKHH